MKSPAVLTLALVFLVRNVIGAEQVATSGEYAVLSGLSGLAIAVLGPKDDGLGLTQKRLTTIVELKLRSAGIKILSREEARRLPERPFLSVIVEAGRSSDLTQIVNRITWFNLSVQVHTTVLPKHGTLKEINAACIYSHSYTGFAGNEKWVGDAVDELNEFMDRLCNDFLKANPKTK